MVSKLDGAEYPSHGVYVEIDEPGKLVWGEACQRNHVGRS